MRPFFFAMALLAALSLAGRPAVAEPDPRNATREQVRQVLALAGPRIDVAFQQSTAQPYSFEGSMTSSLRNADSLEILVIVTKDSTVEFRVYPHYKKGYINVGKAADSPGLMRKLLSFSDRNFLYWGADDSGDIFSGYTITLESGFPQDAMVVVLRSIRGTDKFVGQLRPFIDRTTPA